MKTVKLKTYLDTRGALSENSLEEIMIQSRHFFVSTSKPGVVRGNHYHTKKNEWFYVIRGKCRIVVEDIHTKKREEIVVDETNPVLVNMEPLHAHAIENIGDAEMILLALINEPFDQKKPDTIPYIVIELKT